MVNDGVITIAMGKSRKETKWKNKEMLWSELIEKFKVTTRTRETHEEYKKLSKGDQDNIKDVGGFVGGSLKSGRRKTDTVASRQLLTLDADFVKGDLWASVEIILGVGCVMYSTHKHSPENQRLRLVIPLNRPVTPDEYQAISRRVAGDLGINFFDDTTYQPHRLMYWPSTSSNGEFVVKVLDETWLNADEVLARYPDWKDSSYWPESSRSKMDRKKIADKQGDPREKTGFIGAFCRTYTVVDVIEKFLSDVYTPCVEENRYTYTKGSTAGGLIIYENGDFAYSHHGTDPASGKLCNAFDLVRLHKFSELDDDVSEETPVVKRPSFKSMMESVMKDGEVKKLIITERIAEAEEDFKDEGDWQERLTVDKKGEIINSLKNLIIILENDAKINAIVFNQLSDGMEIKGEVPWKHPSKWWRDADDAQLISYIDITYGSFSARNYDIAVTKVTDDRSYHPIKEYLEGLPEWDGIKRLDTLLIDYLGAEDSVYVQTVTRKVFTAAVKRIYEPGIKFDWMLVLSGETGIGKSTLVQKFAGEWFNDSLKLSDTKDKTAAEKLQGYWILEIGELAGMKKAEEDILKSFLSSPKDVYRASFGKRAVPHLRQCIFIGTTNAKGYLRDTTGNRRFWPVKVFSSKKKPWEITQIEINQTWAEAIVNHLKGEELQLSDELEKYAAIMQNEALEVDDRQGIVESYIAMLLPDDWESMDLFKRREYISDYYNEDTIIPKGTSERDQVSVIEIWCEAFGKNKADLERIKSYEITKMLRHIKNWEKSEKLVSGGIYGRRMVFEKVN